MKPATAKDVLPNINPTPDSDRMVPSAGAWRYLQ